MPKRKATRILRKIVAVDDYSVYVDTNQFTVKRKSKAGETTIGYYSTFYNALSAILGDVPRGSKAAATLEAALAEMHKMTDRLVYAVNTMEEKLDAKEEKARKPRSRKHNKGNKK